MKNYWLKKYRLQELMEDAFAIYHLSLKKIPELNPNIKNELFELDMVWSKQAHERLQFEEEFQKHK